MDKESIKKVLDELYKEISIYKNFVSQNLIRLSTQLYEYSDTICQEEKEEIATKLVNRVCMDEPHIIVWIYSVCMYIERSSNSVLRLMEYIDDYSDFFSMNTLYFLVYQIRRFIFLYPAVNSKQVKIYLWKMYRGVCGQFKKCFSLERIPYEQRNKNLIIFLSGQVLGTNHAPTRIAYDRCIAVQQGLKKEVLLINTAEVMTQYGAIPFFNQQVGTYAENKKNEQFQEWKGYKIPFFQCNNRMPDIEYIEVIINFIKKLAPERVVSLGGMSIVADLINCLVPTLTVGLGATELDITMTDYQTLSRNTIDEDIEILSELDFNPNHIINNIFTFGLKEQKEYVSKKELDVEDKFLIAVIGYRLDSDITEDFLEVLDKIVNDDILVGFWGIFEEYEDRVSKHSKLYARAKYFGKVDDVLPIMDIADLYVNPTRLGGGTSCVEAMHKGVPVVTVKYGDVAINAGDDFCVSDYDEMGLVIQKYCDDKEFYGHMSEMAIRRSEELLDSEGEFIRILSEVEKKELEK